MGGHHRIHIHENSHVSGFYFLQNENSSYPLFHDPRPGSCIIFYQKKIKVMLHFIVNV